MAGPSSIIIGSFDGVHRGHAALVQAARESAGRDGRVVVLSFDPHPLATLHPAAAPARLSRFEQRRRWLAELGADEVVRLDPRPEMLALAPEAFLGWLAAEHRPSVVVEGPDFRFGRGRAGGIETLRELGPRLGFRTIVVEPVEARLADGSVVRVSSSLARWLLSHGRAEEAADLLGRPYAVAATVAPGDRRGRELGVPTANLETDQLLPADGIYAGRARGPDGRTYPAAISIGTKPTFGGSGRVCEAHLLGFDGRLDHYGWTTELEVTRWMRDQLTYGSAAALVAQIERDIAEVASLVTVAATG
jgi:riboflavin kinase/FMN adenylyltransferase